MNLSEESIKDLEHRAYLRGLREALDAAWKVIDSGDMDVEERSGAHSVRLAIEELLEKNENS